VRVLVTGGIGFVGSHLARRLVQQGDEVHIIVRPSSSTWRIDDVSRFVALWRGDLTDTEFVSRCMLECRPEMVFHLAADTRSRGMGADFSAIKSTLAINLVATLGLLEKLNHGDWPVRSFVRTGGLEEYGSGPYPSIESQRESPVSPYSASQVAATHYCVMLQQYLRFPAITIRPALIYGPAQSSQFFIPSLIEHCLRGRDFEMTSGQQARDLLYVDDVVDALIRASVADGLGGQIINVGSAKEYRLLDVAQAVRAAAGATIGLRVGCAPERPAEIQQLVCNSDKARVLLGWVAQTDLQTGLARTLGWYRKHLDRASDDHL